MKDECYDMGKIAGKRQTMMAIERTKKNGSNANFITA